MQELSDKATLVDRIQHYVHTKQIQKAKALAQLGDYLEECFLWEIEFHNANQSQP